jgi:hypothetical protein
LHLFNEVEKVGKAERFCKRENRKGSKDSLLEKELDDRQFLVENCLLLGIQMGNAALAYGIVPSLISYVCGKYDHSSKVLLFATGRCHTLPNSINNYCSTSNLIIPFGFI